MKRFEIVYEDGDVVVVDKAPGVLTVPTHKRERNTLVDSLRAHLRRDVFVVHRLDRDTSGLLVFAKSIRIERALEEQWSSHERVYEAIVSGVVKRDEGTIESRMITTKNLDRRSVRSHERGGERAVTHFRMVERMRDATLVEVKLDTGRRNQIRVHLAELGHPILGDVRYARDVRPNARWRSGLALHARKIAFAHPITRERVECDAGRRADFTDFLDGAKRSPRRRAPASARRARRP